MSPQNNGLSTNSNNKSKNDQILFQLSESLTNPPPGEEIVISGLAGHYPDAAGVLEFQENLLNKVDMVSGDTRRWEPNHPEVPQRSGKMKEIEKLDAGFFGIHHRQAETMDPTVRGFLERATECIFDAGLHPSDLEGTNCGVFVGACFSETEKTWFFDNVSSNSYAITGCQRSMIPNRISYYLKLNGPSFITDTACSSSLYALEHAYRAIRNGECETAIVGCTNVCLHPFVSLQFYRLGVLSLDGACKAFDAAGNGYARSETIAAIFLQKSKDANRIYAKVVHAKTNCDGYKEQGITYPSGEAQRELLEQFYLEAPIKQNDISFLEAHGTGTVVGDPEEVMAIDSVFFKSKKRTKPLLIGSVKSNIGHTEPSSGLCSVTKAIIAFESGFIPPNLHFTKPREGLEALEQGRLKVVTEKTRFQDNQGLIGINSFGFGGGNCHVVLKWNTNEKVNGGTPRDDLPRLVYVSGRKNESVSLLLNEINKSKLDVEYIKLIHNVFRKDIPGHNYRGYSILSKSGEIKRSSSYFPGECGKLFFAFSDYHTSWRSTGKYLFTLPIFAATLQMVHNILSLKNINLMEIFFNDNDEDNVCKNIIGHVAVQIGLAEILKSLKITPYSIFGSTFGEIACAFQSDILSLEQTVLITYELANFIHDKIDKTSTYILKMASQTLKKLVPNDLEIFVLDDDTCLLSGNVQKMDIFIDTAEMSNIAKIKLPSQGYNINKKIIYSPIKRLDILHTLNKIIGKPKQKSNWMSRSNSTEEYVTAEYFLNSLEMGPNNVMNLSESIPNGAVIFEFGNGNICGVLKEKLTTLDNINYIALECGNSSDIVPLLECLGKLYNCGYNPQIHKLYPKVALPVSRGTPMISPHIKWNHDADWFVTKYKSQNNLKTGQRVVIISTKDEDWKFISGHVVDGRNLFPATGYLYLVWETLTLFCGAFMNSVNIVFENVKFLRATTVRADGEITEYTVTIQPGSGNFEVIEGGNTIVTGKTYLVKDMNEHQLRLPLPIDLREEDIVLKTKDVYKELRLRGYNYKGAFRGILECDANAEAGLIRWDTNWVTFIDNMLQMKILELDSRNLYVPTGIEKLTIDCKKHLSIAKQQGENPILPIYNYKDIGVMKCGAIEIQGIIASSIARRKPLSDPVLEKYMFIPNETNLDIPQSIRVLMQLVLEMSYIIKVKAVEVIDEGTPLESEPLGPIVHDVLADQPLIQPNIIVLTKNIFENNDLTIEDRNLLTESDCLIVIGTNLLQRTQMLQNAFSVLKENGFILSRETLLLNLNSINLEGLDIISIHTTPKEKLILFRKSVSLQTPKALNISNEDTNFEWVPELQELIKNDASVVIFSQNDALSGILGLANCLRREPGGNNIKCFFILDPNAPKFDLNNDFYLKQWQKNMSFNVYKEGAWGTYRHLKLEECKEVEREHCYVNVTVRGDLSSMRYIEGPLSSKAALEPQETLVNVYYTAINFRDIMTASGRINADVITMDRREQECVQGFEFSGRTIDGKRVAGMIPSKAFATLVTADSDILFDVPDSWSLEEAASVVVVYGTALYALLTRGNMKPGESVLIHSGSGGVGLAAIQIALFYGCTVYTTVGTPEKRNIIKQRFPQLTDENISNSRDSSFEEFINTQTKGKGVDLVLNSLAEEKLIASVRCLAKGGRFLEIGKFDLANNNRVSLMLLEKEASFHGIMLDVLFKSDRTKKKVLSDLLREGMANGSVQPLERTVFEDKDLEKAFRYMATGKHTGKVLVKIRQEEQERCVKPPVKLRKGIPRYYCNSDKCYVICGGLGGFGLELADWLILRGARKIILTSRNGIKNGYQAMRIRIWKSYGATVLILKEDILTTSGCEKLLNKANNLGPVEAIFNLAVVLKDAIFENQTPENYKLSFGPKAIATKHLDELSRTMCPQLKNFVIFSSVSCGRGNAGQTNYGMANSIMERICEQRRTDGFPALAIEWGAVGEVGLVAEMQEEQFDIEIGGTLQQRIANCLSVMDIFLSQDNTIVSSMVVAEKRAGLGAANNIVTTCANILGIRDLKIVSLHATLAELGMDSMTAVEIKQTLEREFEVFLTAQDIRSMTFARLYEIQLEKESEDGGKAGPKDKIPVGIEMVLRFLSDEKDSKIPVVRLESKIDENSAGPNIFLFPGMEGSFKTLVPLAKNLNVHPLAMQFTFDNPENSLFEMAESIVPLLEEKMNKTDLFTIIAYSFGTTIALEAVAILESKGYKVNVILIDGAPEMLTEMARTHLQVESEVLLQTSLICALMACFTPLDIIDKNKDKLLKCATLEERMRKAQEIVPKGAPHTPEYQRTVTVGLYKRIKGLVDYKPSYSKIQSKVTLCKPKHLSVSGLSKDYKLSELCQNEVDILEFEGTHISILENIKLAETINNFCLSNQQEEEKLNVEEEFIVNKTKLVEPFDSNKIEINVGKEI